MLFQMLSGPIITVGPVANVAYLDQASCSAKVFKEVCLIAISGQRYRFNKLLLASISNMFRDVMLGHFSSPHYAHGDKVCITTEFNKQELEHLYELCHYGQLTLNTQDTAEQCLKALGINLADFDMTAQVFDGTVIKMEDEEEDGNYFL